MNKKRSLYEAPKSEILVVQTEGVICESGSTIKDGVLDDEWDTLSLKELLGLDF